MTTIPDNHIQLCQAEQVKSQEMVFQKQFDLEASARKNFIKKVYSILTIQLLITFAVCLVSIKVPAFLEFQTNNQFLMWISLAVMIAVQIAMICTQLGKIFPTNTILLLVFTLCQAYLVSFTCGLIALQNGAEIVVTAALMTFAIVASLTCYAWFTKKDFTISYGILVTVLTALVMLFFISIFSYSPFVNNLLCAVGAIIFSIYIVIDTQMIIGQKKYSISMDDYILGALILYIDIIQLFLYILRLLKNNN